MVLALSGCGKSATVATEAATTSSVAAASSQPVPYFVSNAEGWTLDDGVDEGPLIGVGPLNLKWTAAWERWPTPNQSIGAALALGDPEAGGAREVAAIFSSDFKAVTIGGRAAFAGEERNRDGVFTAAQIQWDEGDYVVMFTVYETPVTEALELAEHIAPVSQEQWRATMRAAT